MILLSTIGAEVIATPMNEVYYWQDAETPSVLLSRQSVFQVCIEQLLIDDDFLFGAAGPVVNGPDLFIGLTCSLILRYQWLYETEGTANFKIGPNLAYRNPNYNSAEHSDVEWYYHPEGTLLDGFPRFMRNAHIYSVQTETKF